MHSPTLTALSSQARSVLRQSISTRANHLRLESCAEAKDEADVIGLGLNAIGTDLGI